MKELSPYPSRDPLTATGGYVSRPWDVWIRTLWAAVNDLVSGRAGVRVVATSEPATDARAIQLFSEDGETLKVKRPDGTVKTVVLS